MSSYKADDLSSVEFKIELLTPANAATITLLLVVFANGMNVNETDRQDVNIGIMRFLT